jgi:hypothetical protein
MSESGRKDREDFDYLFFWQQNESKNTLVQRFFQFLFPALVLVRN